MPPLKNFGRKKAVDFFAGADDRSDSSEDESEVSSSINEKAKGKQSVSKFADDSDEDNNDDSEEEEDSDDSNTKITVTQKSAKGKNSNVKPSAQEIFGVEDEEEDESDDDDNSDEEDNQKASLKNDKSNTKKSAFSDDDDEEEEDDGEEEETEISKSKPSSSKLSKSQDDESDDDDDFNYNETDEENEDSNDNETDLQSAQKEKDQQDSKPQEKDKKSKFKKQKNLIKNAKDASKRVKKSGLVYISRVPEMMNPSGMRQILERFGEVGRLYLVPAEKSREDKEEEEAAEAKNKKSKNGKKGRKPRFYKEGWAEFIRKKDAKLCAGILDGRTTLGGKNRRSRFYDTVVAVRYLKGFKWNDLAEQMVAEKEAYAMQLKKEIGLGNEESRFFAESVAIAKSVAKKRKYEQEHGEYQDESENKKAHVSRNFDQRAAVSKRAGEGNEFTNRKKEEQAMNSVLSKIF